MLFFGDEPVGSQFPGNGSALLFSVSVSAVPEPGSWALMAEGTGWRVSRRLRHGEDGAGPDGLR